MAAAHVTGAVALYLQRFVALPPSQLPTAAAVKQAILALAEPGVLDETMGSPYDILNSVNLLLQVVTPIFGDDFENGDLSGWSCTVEGTEDEPCDDLPDPPIPE